MTDAVRIVMETGRGHSGAAPRAIAAALDIAADELALERDARGKPAVRTPVTDLCFSVAHTSGLTLVALASGVEVGIDVERLGRDVTGWRLWEQTLTSDELAHLPADRAARNRALLQSWVRREALLKAAGVGLAVDPLAIELAADGRIVELPRALGSPAAWSLDDVAIPGCAAAIACRPGRTRVEVIDSSPAVGDRGGPGSMQP